MNQSAMGKGEVHVVFHHDPPVVVGRVMAALVEGEWQVFFGVCDRLLDQLKPFDELIALAENSLSV